MRVRSVAVVFSAALVLALVPKLLRAQEMDVPVPVQAALFTRVLGFDRNLSTTGAPLRVAVLYQGRNRASLSAAEEIRRSLSDATVLERRIEVVSIDLDRKSVTDALAEVAPYAVYVAPVRATDMGEIAAVLRRRRIRSFTGVPAYVTAGLAVGVRTQRDRPRLLINLEAARAEGAEYQSGLLQLAEIVR